MPNGSVEIVYGDGEYVFNIAKIKCALELEEKCGAGVAKIFERLCKGDWHINDVRETLRIGLIGGGLDPTKASKLIKRYFDERPWREGVEPAMVVLMAAMVGVPGDESGKKPKAEQAKEEEQPSSGQMADSSAPQSTDSAPLSNGIPAL